MRWRLVTILLSASLLPLALLGAGAWVVFGSMLEAKALELHRTVVKNHATIIDLYLQERLRALETLARTHSLEELTDDATLQLIFAELSAAHDGAFVDLGIIGTDGSHLAYVGEYDLKHKNYAQAAWFREVMQRGSFVSDVFRGYRRVPHCIIAIKRPVGDAAWIVRATLNSQQFDALVRTARVGASSDAFIVNAKGIYQTPPQFGHVLEASPITAPKPHDGVQCQRVNVEETPTLRATAWLNDQRWLLVVQQTEQEAQAPLHRAMAWGLVVVLLAVVAMVVTTLLATWHLDREILQAREQQKQLSRDLLRSARLASLGELASGLAHEINNPLAILSSERTNLGDLVEDAQLDASTQKAFGVSLERFRRQIERCAAITAKMLQFGHKSETKPQATELEPRLAEVAQLLRKQAEVRNVAMEVHVDPDLPTVTLDPTELEQVLVNLITNSFQAMNGGGQIQVRARRRRDHVELTVADTGSGIAKDDVERVFQPFFTTKPVGEGTGLGLPVCYGIVRSWGGTIEVDSQVGQGTTMTIRLPVAASPLESNPRSTHG